MSTAERRQRILDLATSTGTVSVEYLADHFGVTSSTIRRDLARLTDEGRITRTYGGVVPVGSHPESTLNQRLGEAREAKVLIARKAAQVVRPGDTLMLDAGSTVAALAAELRHVEDLTVATVSLSVVEILADSPGIAVDCVGGRLRSLSHGFLGPLAEVAIERMTCDALFLGTDGVSANGEICEADQQQTRLKEVMARRAQHVYVLAHGDKIGRDPFHAWLAIPRPWTLITDPSAPEEILHRLVEKGVDVEIADA